MKILILLFIIILSTVSAYSIPGYNWQSLYDTFNGVKAFSFNHFIIIGNDGRLIQTFNGGNTFEFIDIDSKLSFYSIDFKDESSGILTSDSGYVFITTDKMQTWEKIKIYDNYLNKVKILNENFVYAFNKEAVLISNDFGKNWELVYHNDSSNIEQVNFINQSIAFITGKDNLFIKTEDGGENWDRIFKAEENIENYGFGYIDENINLIGRWKENS